MTRSLVRLLRALPLAVLFLPVMVYAQQKGLVPCGNNLNSSDYLGATACNLCDFGQLIQNVINYLLFVSIPFGVALFFYAGVLLVTSGGSQEKITRGKKIFSAVIIGFLVVCTAWLVIQTVVLGLVTDNTIFTGGSWNSVKCADNSQRTRDSKISDLLDFGKPSTVRPGGGGTGGGGTGGGTGTPKPGTLADQQARTELNNICTGAGVPNCFTFSSTGNCTDQTNASCTSLQGVQPATLLKLSELRQTCGCSLNITGGTEVGHGTNPDNVHTQGAAIDFNKNPQLNAAIQAGGTATTVSVGGGQAAAIRAADGTLFIDEGTHWHMQLPNTTPGV